MITIFSDPHLGVNRRSHTTARSRELLKQAVYEPIGKLLFQKLAETSAEIYCLGDLFDKYSNKEAVISQGYTIASKCHIILAGNHDLSNAGNQFSSLELMSILMDSSDILLKSANYGHYFIPHQLTQEKFEEELQKAYASIHQSDGTNCLFLHCCYNSPFLDESETALNLTEPLADKLLEKFGRIFIGHEHNYREHKDGRIILTGNTFPTSFGDISDKYIWHLDGTELIKEKVWDKSTGYLSIDYVPGMSIPDRLTTQTQFIDLVGEVDAKDMPDYAEFVTKLWRAGEEHLLMVRNEVKVNAAEVEEVEADLKDVYSAVVEELDNSQGLKELWQKLYKEVKSEEE